MVEKKGCGNDMKMSIFPGVEFLAVAFFVGSNCGFMRNKQLENATGCRPTKLLLGFRSFENIDVVVREKKASLSGLCLANEQ